ncbi:protein kinase domain-containing protein, partial [Actinophytocola sediminis]
MTTADGGWQPGATVLGEFAVEHALRGGGAWRVALVRDGHGERHAVKRVVVGDLIAQQRFLAGIDRWLRLPAHPHLAACRFVRALGDELLVFSEYADGGSLADWIRDGQLYADADPTGTVLRVATEAAWGLDAAHTMGLPHLDVKPANVLLTAAGSAKLTDFATPREPDHLRHLEVDGTIQAAPEGAYAAPEQAEDQPVGRDADVWSWAVTVLEMFAGERTWPSGALADAVLEQLVTNDRWRVPMPAAVAEVLRTCLRFDPARRPRSFAELAGTLTEIGGALGLPRRAEPARPSVLGHPPHRGWSDPRAWLTLAYETAGLDPRSAAVFFPAGHIHPAPEDLRAFAVARRVLDQAGAPVWPRARLRADTGRVALRVGDTGTGVANLLACADLLAGREDDDSRLLLASVLTDLAVAGDGDGPADAHDQAVAAAEELTDHPEVLGAALLAKAEHLGDPDLYAGALTAFQRAGDAPRTVTTAIAMARALHAADLPDPAARALAAIDPPTDALAELVG